MEHPVTDREVLNDCFTRATVLESLFIELLAIVSAESQNPAQVRNAVFQNLREDLREFGKKTDGNGTAYTRLAIRITDQIEKRMLMRSKPEASQ